MRAAMLLTLMLGSATATAADLAECARIAADAPRLACYDHLARAAPAAGLGAETLPARSAPADSRLSATLVGDFSGWKQGTRFTLDNGEVWSVIGDDEFDCQTLHNPKVTVEKGLLNYWARFGDIPRTAKVRRIK